MSMLMYNNNNFLLILLLILFLLVRGGEKKQTAGVNPPFKIDIKLVLCTAGTDFVHAEELLEEVEDLEEETS